MSLIRKDLGIALEAGEAADANLLFGKKAIETYKELEKKGEGKKDFGIVYRYIHQNLKISKKI